MDIIYIRTKKIVKVNKVRNNPHYSLLKLYEARFRLKQQFYFEKIKDSLTY